MSPETTDFLYPFLEGDEHDSGPLLADLAASARAKEAQSRALRDATLVRDAAVVEAVAGAMAERFRAGGQLFCFGNGGSSTDAWTVSSLYSRPPSGTALPARSLVADLAVLTALGNDVGFELVFSRQLIAHGRPVDIAMGLSTSGSSANLLKAFSHAHARGLLTIGVAGYDGGQMAVSPDVDHCLVVRSESVHRVQEVQAALAVELWARVRRAMGDILPTPTTDHGGSM
jgi:D-sedoheptulose 7-phosphate isomerase